MRHTSADTNGFVVLVTTPFPIFCASRGFVSRFIEIRISDENECLNGDQHLRKRKKKVRNW